MYKEYGDKGLKEVKRGRKKGYGKLLSPFQEKEIQKMIVDKMPDQLKLPYAIPMGFNPLLYNRHSPPSFQK